MATFRPFAGVRYDPAAIDLQEVIAPPYDVVSPEERADLAGRSPQNAVHLELPEPENGLDRYQAAAGLLASWLGRHVLLPDPRPSLYPYRMTSPSGRSSIGVIGALGIGDGVLPHEQTLPKPKSDRLDLLRATRANLSPIWGLSLSAGLTASFMPTDEPVASAIDDDGVRHELWVVDDPRTVAAVAEAVAASAVVIADGHHRYETAGIYRDEVRAANGGRPGEYDAVMALVVELAEEQLDVSAIHRLVNGLPAHSDVLTAFERWFDAVHAGPATERVVGALAESRALALITAGGAWMLTPRPGAIEAAGADLDSAGVDLALDGADVGHCYSWGDGLAAVRAGKAQAAVLLRPVTVAQIAEWAGAGRLMPPKTTYFSPKPRTGMVFRLLSG